MATPVVIPNVIRCAFRGTWTNGRPIVNVLHAQLVTAPGDSRDAAVDEWLKRSAEDWKTILLPQLLNNYTFEGIDWVDMNSADGRTGFEARSATGTNTGGRSPAAMAPHTAVLVHKNVTGRTRGRRSGRWYLTTADEGGVDEDGKVLSGLITFLQPALNNLLTNLNEDLTISPIETVDVGVASHPIQAGLPPKFLKISSLTVDTTVGTQRRRVVQG